MRLSHIVMWHSSCMLAACTKHATSSVMDWQPISCRCRDYCAPGLRVMAGSRG